MVQEIKAFRTSDGNVFVNILHAENHEKGLEFNKRLNTLLEEYHYMTYEDQSLVEDFIEEKGQELFEILKLKYGECVGQD